MYLWWTIQRPLLLVIALLNATIIAHYSPAAYNYSRISLLCIQAYKRGILYPKYQLLVYGWYSDGWWRESDPTRLDCTQQEINTALNHAMAPVQAEFYTNKSLVTEGRLVGFMYIHCHYKVLCCDILVCKNPAQYHAWV